jgi:hypothetical protein
VEFAILLPVFLGLFLLAFDIGVLLIRQVMLERALDLTARDLRLAALSTDPGPIADAICARARLLPDCPDRLAVRIGPFDLASAADRSACDRPAAASPPGAAAGAILLVDACIRVDPLVPGAGLFAGTAGGASIEAVALVAREPVGGV